MEVPRKNARSRIEKKLTSDTLKKHMTFAELKNEISEESFSKCNRDEWSS